MAQMRTALTTTQIGGSVEIQKPEPWLVRVYVQERPDYGEYVDGVFTVKHPEPDDEWEEERLLTDIPVHEDRWKVITRSILGVWRAYPNYRVRAEVMDGDGNLRETFSCEEADYPE